MNTDQELAHGTVEEQKLEHGREIGESNALEAAASETKIRGFELLSYR